MPGRKQKFLQWLVTCQKILVEHSIKDQFKKPSEIPVVHVYYLGWNRSPAQLMHQVGCMRQVLGPGALGRPRGIGWRGRWEGRSGWGIHVNPWLIHVNVWQKPLQYCKVISLQLIKINEKKEIPVVQASLNLLHLLQWRRTSCQRASHVSKWGKLGKYNL